MALTTAGGGCALVDYNNPLVARERALAEQASRAHDPHCHPYEWGQIALVNGSGKNP